MRSPAVLVACFVAGCHSPAETGGHDTQRHTGQPDTDTDADVDTGPIAPACSGVDPSVGDTEGGGGRVVVAVDAAGAVSGVTLGGVPMTALQPEDPGHVSGILGLHAPGAVEVVVAYATGAKAVCPGTFEYWTPARIANLDAYFDAGKGVTDAGGGAVAAWVDQGPNGRVAVQDTTANRPTLVGKALGDLPVLRFTPGCFLRLAAPVDLSAAGTSTFAVARWTATTDAVTGNPGNVPLTIVGDGTNAYGAFGAKGGQVASNHYVGGPVLVDGGSGLNDGVARLMGATYDTVVEARIYVGNNQQGLDAFSAPLVGANTWDTLGAGYAGADGWDGDLAAVVVVSGVVSVEDRTRLDLWARQRFGTPASPALDPWTREVVGEMPASWYHRDGAQMVELASGRILFIGGWSPYDPWGGDRVTNEVWASDDGGATWALLLAHDPDPPKRGEGARFPPGHTVGVTPWDGHAMVMGSDPLRPPYLGEVWRESDDGATWTLVADDAPTADRCLFMAGSLGSDLYVMGGQTSLYDEATAIADTWRSSDGGVTWTRLADPPWSGRGMVYRPVAQDGRLYVVGGGRYDDTDPVAFNGVFAFDGTSWTEVLPDGHDQWEASYYHGLAALDGRLWLLGGYTGTAELQRALLSDDGGATWSAYPGGAGGRESHADAVVALPKYVLRVSGNLNERWIHRFVAP